MTSTSPSLLHRSLHVRKWNYLGTLVRIGTQFNLGIVLARLLRWEALPFLRNVLVSAYSAFTNRIETGNV